MTMTPTPPSPASPPTLTEGWSMPAPPSPGFVATYYLDRDGVYLGWADPKTGEPHQDAPSIAWPWKDDAHASTSDLVALGFIDVEECGPWNLN